MPQCASCQADNRDGAKFCSSCGAPMSRPCPACGTPASGRFCAECGAPLTDVPPLPVQAGSPAPPSAPAEPAAAVAERRITSVLFGDLVGFTPLSESLDAEDVRELLSRYFTTARTVVERYGGVVEKFIGDAVMAVWGVPTAHEDDAERAVRAGLDLVDVVASLGEEIGHRDLAMRVGVVTGEVAVTVGATGEGMVAGDAVNTAARVQAQAEPGHVWVDDQTRELTAAAVLYDDVGAHELKGKAEPVRLFAARQVVAAVGGARRVDGLEAPFVGRDRELRLVKELFHAALEERRPRLVAVFGAAGVGKSRLGWEFDKYYDGISTLVRGHRGRCLSYGEGVSFWALAEMVRGRLEVMEGDGNDVVVDRLHAGLERHVPDEAERGWLAPRLATLLGVADLLAPGTSFARDDLFAAWRTFLERVAVSGDSNGAILRIDDLQWADTGLLEFLDHLLETARAPIFVLTLARTELIERAPSFGTGRRATALHLEPLPQEAMTRLVDGLVDGLPEQLRDTLVERSEGIPLFAVETVRGLIDRDAVIPRGGRYVFAPDAAARVDLSNIELPTSLHTLIASRLDALPADERRAVQNGAVMGLSFTRSGLESVSAAVGDPGDLADALDALVRKEILAIESDPRSPERGQYRFVQALVRAVAYDTLARRDRKARHLAAAAHLAAEPDADTIPAVLASHYLDAHAAAPQDPDAAELVTQAVALLERAAAHARALGAPAEARHHLETALSLAVDPVDTARLTEQTTVMALAMGAGEDAIELAERARDAYAAAGLDVEAGRCVALISEARLATGTAHLAVEPMREAYERLKDRPDAIAVVARLSLEIGRVQFLSLGDSRGSMPWFDRAVDLAEAMADLPLLATALASYAGALIVAGRARMGLGLLRVSLEIARKLDEPHAQLRPINNLISFLAARDLEEARGYCREGIALVHRLGNRETGLNMMVSAAHVFWNCGDWDETLNLAAEVGSWGQEGSPVDLLRGFVAAVHEARGMPFEAWEEPASNGADNPDRLVGVFRRVAESARLRARGDLAGAADMSFAALTDYSALNGLDDDFPFVWTMACDDARAIGDAEMLRKILAVVAGAPRGHLTPLVQALIPHVRAGIAQLAGDDATVEADLRDAVGRLREFGAPFPLARALLDLGSWLHAHHRADEAASVLREAGELFGRLGARPWVDRVVALTPVEPALAATPAGSAGT